MHRIAPALFACFVVFACSFSFAGSLIKNPPHTNVTRTTGGYNYSMNPSTTYKVLGSETTPSRVAPSSAGTSLMMAEEQAATWPNGAVIDATLETAISGAEIAATLATAAKSGKITPAGLLVSAVSQFAVQALINQGMQWMADAKQYVHPATDSLLIDSSKWECTALWQAGLNIPGTLVYYKVNNVLYENIIVAGSAGTAPTGYPNHSLGCGASPSTYGAAYGAFQRNLGSAPMIPADYPDFLKDFNAEMAAKPDLNTWSHAFNDANTLAPDTNVAQPSRPQVVTVNTPTQTTLAKQTQSTTTVNPDGSTTTSTTNSTTTTNATPSGSTVNNTATNVTSSTTNVTTTTNNTTNATTTTTSTNSDPTPTPAPDPTPTPDPAVAPPAIQFPTVPTPTPVPDGPPQGQTNFLSWSPFASFSFSCTDPSVPILGKDVAIPLCQWIDKIRVFFFWFWNVATAIGIYLLGRGFNINTASAKTEE